MESEEWEWRDLFRRCQKEVTFDNNISDNNGRWGESGRRDDSWNQAVRQRGRITPQLCD